MTHKNRSKNPKPRLRFELRGRCPQCNTERILWGYIVDNNPVALDAVEARIEQIGKVKAICPVCNIVERVAFFADGDQKEPWMDANEYEQKFGKSAGQLPKGTRSNI